MSQYDMMISMKKIVLGMASATAAFYEFVLISTAFAQNSSPTLANPLGANTTATDVLNNVNAFLLAIAAPLCGIMVVWGGFQMITAAGNPEKFSSGRKTLLYAAVGFVVVIFASSVVPLIKNIVNGS
jgi:hypothetical protein